jgi:hypothetical protein
VRHRRLGWAMAVAVAVAVACGRSELGPNIPFKWLHILYFAWSDDRRDDSPFLVFWLVTDVSYSSISSSNGVTIYVRCPSPSF